ncbi:MAG: acetyl-CoA C-acetyltransferase [Xanthomonadales bacterium]|nr:acetyl-CoA C-acetyltransferase [Gammaproteobacteria bacterium]MBT8051351.1 acetyl-CoA C-acetyltransferase [Gammaproteobacteria bacterium]MBT8057366.1 acetyl-CoA C-acetyltransferase [Gammaproteobacteria bacterium]NNJ80359.1 acetyl-CoA C-acetyltransferase [Xanthomonadales bacterium]NNL04021.1 acetyl-CoA C-acetyltransferase [Xanthomonadales bacterium]
MSDAFIYDHLRSPRGRGKAGGALNSVTPIELTSQVLRGLRDRNGLDTGILDDVVLGCVAPVGEQGANIARVAAMNADYAQSVPGKQINRFCASGLEAVNTVAAQVMAGQSTAGVAGGIESMSRVPMMSDGGAWAIDPQVAIHTYFVPQGISADLIATRDGISRNDCDAYAVESQHRAANAWNKGYFKGSVLPIVDHLGEVILDHDETVRGDASMESLADLNPAFAKMGAQAGFDDVAIQKYPEIEAIDHVHTAGNSSGIVDGAAAVLVASREAGQAMGLQPRARIRSFASIGSEPTIMLTGPAPASKKALGLAGMTASDIDLWELNEAFASVVLHYMNELGVTHDRINVNGGAIAMGHPLGATGAIVLGTLLDEMERRDLEIGLVSLCIGAGMGTATIIERV